MIKVITTVQFIVDFIGARGFQLQNFLRKEREGDVIYCCDGRWCGRAEVLKRIAELYDVIEEFTTSKNEPNSRFNDREGTAGFAFLTDILRI